jgi:hypothetical protein
MARRSLRIGETESRELTKEDVRIVRQAAVLVWSEAVEDLTGSIDMRLEQPEQFAPVGEPMQLRYIIERVRLQRQQVRLGILDHLHAMLGRPQQPVRFRKLGGSGFVQPAR